MSVQLRILSGTRAGEVFRPTTEVITIGREPGLDLQFDSHRQREVSARHANLFLSERGWLVRDLGSTNGTLVNGTRIFADTLLCDSDVLRLGPTGPELRFEQLTASPRSVSSVRSQAHSASHGPTSTTKLRAQLAHHTRRARTVSIGLVFLAAGVVGFSLWINGRAQADWEQERRLLLASLDSVLSLGDETAAALEDQVSGLAEALRESRDEAGRFRSQLRDRPSERESEAEVILRQRLQEATVALERQQLAASLDWTSLRARGDPAVARVFAESQEGVVEAATAFLVGEDGTLATAGHLVAGVDGLKSIRRLAVQFGQSDRFQEGYVVRISLENDVAIIRLSAGPASAPPLALNQRPDTIGRGQPVAMIGFPLGGIAPEETNSPTDVARPLASAGIVLGSGPERLEIQGYGERGASGSPVLDSSGAVVGLLRGAIMRDDRPVLVAVPSTAIISLLGGS